MKAPAFWEQDTLPSRLLQPLAHLYNRTRRTEGLSAARVSIPVICVGNVVAGGAGKTPVALKLNRMLRAEGWNPHFISRGYGGAHRGEPMKVEPNVGCRASEVGDEPLLLAEESVCWVGQDRVAAARLAGAYGADCVIMDDGLQNPSLHKDIALLVIDGEYGLGNGRMLPAGPLREPLEEALERVQAVILLGEDRHGLRARIPQSLPVFEGKLQPDPATLETIKQRRVVAFAGLGRPEKFRRTLEEAGIEIVSFHAFADHHPYSVKELQRLRAEAAASQAVLVTTAKDRVRLLPGEGEGIQSLPVTLSFADENGVLHWLLEHLPHAREAA